MGEADFLVCPECRDEYTLNVLRCADCDVALVSPGAIPPDAAPEAFPPVAQLEIVRIAPLEWIRALSQGLEQAGLPHRVEPARPGDAPAEQNAEAFGDVDLFGLYVRAGELEAARGLDARIEEMVMPAEGADLMEGQEDNCPACGTPLAADASECPDCGLPFG